MSPTAPEMDTDALAAKVTKHSSLVRQLKKDGAPSEQIGSAVDELKNLKSLLASLTIAEDGKDAFDKKSFDDMVIRKMFVIPSFEIHGGVKGMFDLGPPGCALKVRSCFALLVVSLFCTVLYVLSLFTLYTEVIANCKLQISQTVCLLFTALNDILIYQHSN